MENLSIFIGFFLAFYLLLIVCIVVSLVFGEKNSEIVHKKKRKN